MNGRRVAANTGGDRTYRVDDDLGAVQERLSLFAARTQPLIEFYRAHMAQLLRIDVTAEMAPETMWRALMDAGTAQ